MPMIQLITLGILIYAIWTVIYNRYVHPLSQYPGPFLVSISRLPHAGAYLTGQLHTYVKSLHEKYGDVVRIAPDELSFRTDQAWKDIYGFSTNFPKDPRFFNVAKNGIFNLGVSPTDEIHRRQRRVLASAFSDTALKYQEHLLQGYVDTLIRKLHEEASAGSTVDLVEWYTYTTFDFMAEYVYGESFSCLEDARYHPFVAMQFASVKVWTVLSMSKYLPLLSYPIKTIALYLYRDLFRTRAANVSFTASKIAQRMERAQDPSTPDYIAHVNSKQNLKAKLSEDEIRANAGFLMVAGSETTATSLSGCTFLILDRPEVYQKLVSEIRSRFQSSSEITFASVATLPYLDAVLQESLRMYPPAPLGMPRVVPEGGATIVGKFVPGKIAVSVPHYASYRSPTKFTQADRFLPERWLKEEDDSYTGDERDLIRPFSDGPRGCLGQSLAKAEMKLILVNILWRFDLYLSPECSQWADQKAFVVWSKKPLLTKLVIR
ncbi:cytochrome protein [Penicillium robsamsonii]|uniref:cytochrome protein n=1 Tax=Penicillium robsamsonii TaxID=1792511 RepID=UPI0025479F3D|nr:cytochrome protein [Penicillium robsamsonii]KAJ5835982.1 cytochrome protein [Penicillium robsamsonii]